MHRLSRVLSKFQFKSIKQTHTLSYPKLGPEGYFKETAMLLQACPTVISRAISWAAEKFRVALFRVSDQNRDGTYEHIPNRVELQFGVYDL